MKYLIASLILCLGLVLPIKAQVIILGPERPAPAVEDYERVLDYFKTAAKESTDVKAWKGRELIHNFDKTKIEFDKLSNFDQHMYCMSRGFRINVMEMPDCFEVWSNELKKFDNPKYVPKKRDKIEDAKQNPAAKADVEKYLKQLTELRKSSAVKYEKFVEKVFNDFKDEIPEKERGLYLKELRDFNDENKLIERKKK